MQKKKRRQLDQYLQTWNNNTEASSKGKKYMIFKVLNLEQYFIKLPDKIWTNLLNFRIINIISYP